MQGEESFEFRPFIGYEGFVTVRDIQKLIDYWATSSDYDWKTSQSLFKSKKYPYALFMAHLSVEKLLKGLLVKQTRDQAPFTHNLAYLAGKLPLNFTKEQIQLLEEMSDFNLEARYPDEQKEFYKRATKAFTENYLKRAGEMRGWLKKGF